MIILDTNALRELNNLNGATMHLLQGLARVTGHEIALPKIVVEEFLSHRTRDRQAKAREFRRTAHALRDVLPGWWSQDINDPKFVRSAMIGTAINSPKEVIKELQTTESERLAELFTILEPSREVLQEAFQREAWRTPPARTNNNAKRQGTGGRDALIWLTVLQALNNEDARIVLVSGDRAAFGGQNLLPELAKEAAEKPGHFQLCASVAELLTQLGNVTASPPDLPDLIVTSSLFQEATAERIGQLEHDVAVHLKNFDAVSYQLVPTRPKSITCKCVAPSVAHLIGSEVWTMVEARFQIEHNGSLRNASSHEIEPEVQIRCTYDIDVTATVGTTRGEIIGAEVISVSTWINPRDAVAGGNRMRFRSNEDADLGRPGSFLSPDFVRNIQPSQSRIGESKAINQMRAKRINRATQLNLGRSTPRIIDNE